MYKAVRTPTGGWTWWSTHREGMAAVRAGGLGEVVVGRAQRAEQCVLLVQLRVEETQYVGAPRPVVAGA